ncbi:hypothetical protein MKW98_013987 [Papaver atlanticum]|uniref:Secreted protein n=1 Tax=Papaver atlanticum TaxID=357466 RepID=A0AAD4SJ14_9MAGN|nr:hypothetical protein MKW98_013987 [Papaver atlanticum]
MWAASCLASCCAACACGACRTVVSNIRRSFARIAYCGIFAFSLTVSWILGEGSPPFRRKSHGLIILARLQIGSG